MDNAIWSRRLVGRHPWKIVDILVERWSDVRFLSIGKREKSETLFNSQDMKQHSIIFRTYFVFKSFVNPISRGNSLPSPHREKRNKNFPRMRGSDDYLTINRCCPNLIEGGGRKKFGFNAIFASMRCDRKRVSIISLLGIYIHSRNGMNNKKKGGKGGYTTIDDTTHVKTNRAWLIVGIYWKRRNCDKINVRTFRSQRISMHGMVSEKCVHSVYLYRVIFAWYECK